MALYWVWSGLVSALSDIHFMDLCNDTFWGLKQRPYKDPTFNYNAICFICIRRRRKLECRFHTLIRIVATFNAFSPIFIGHPDNKMINQEC